MFGMSNSIWGSFFGGNARNIKFPLFAWLCTKFFLSSEMKVLAKKEFSENLLRGGFLSTFDLLVDEDRW